MSCGCSGSCGCWWRRVRVFVTARAWKGRITPTLVRAAEVAITHVLAALVVYAGEFFELSEVFLTTAVLAVAAGTVWTVRFSIFRAVYNWLHTQSFVYVSPVMVPEADQVRTTLLIGFACCFSVFFGYCGIIFPWVADVLEAGVTVALVITVTIIYTGFEWGFCFLYLVHTD